MSDKDIETLYFISLLKTPLNDEQVVTLSGGRLSESRIQRIKERIAARTAKMLAPFERNASKKSLT